MERIDQITCPNEASLESDTAQNLAGQLDGLYTRLPSPQGARTAKARFAQIFQTVYKDYRESGGGLGGFRQITEAVLSEQKYPRLY